MTIQPYTDHEWDTLPHVILTTGIDWDLFILDKKQENMEEWNNTMEDLTSLNPYPLFDGFGDHHKTVAIAQVLMMDPIVESYRFQIFHTYLKFMLKK